jgi:colanic acid/amylovoran biosynthesis glycosyltransferase
VIAVMSEAAEAGLHLGYFTNTYPRATDTFIQREVLGLRDLGIRVNTYSIRKSGVEHDVGPLILAEKANTWYALPVGPFALLKTNLFWLFRSPRTYIRALLQALSMRSTGISSLLLQLFYFQEAVLLARQLIRDRIDHLHNHLGDASGNVTLLASTLSGISFSITFHGPHIFFDPFRWSLRTKVKNARFIACISNFCKSQVMLHSDEKDWYKLQVVHCGIDLTKFSNAGNRTARPTFLYVGRLAAEKGLPILLQAVALLASHGYDFRLDLVGDGPDRASLDQLASRLCISDKVRFLGYADQGGVLKHLQNSDFFVLPSFAEGVPVSLMEAMACGVPTIATYVGGISELIANAETGLLVPAADTQALCDAMARYLDDPDLCKEVARRARDKVSREFNIDLEVRKLADHFCVRQRAELQ